MGGRFGREERGVEAEGAQESGGRRGGLFRGRAERSSTEEGAESGGRLGGLFSRGERGVDEEGARESGGRLGGLFSGRAARGSTDEGAESGGRLGGLLSGRGKRREGRWQRARRAAGSGACGRRLGPRAQRQRPHLAPWPPGRGRCRAAVAPVLVGTALAAHDDDLNWLAFFAALIGAIAIQVGTNLSNDYSDARRGADTEDRLGPVRVTAGGLVPPRQALIATWASFGVAVLVGIYLIAIAGWARWYRRGVDPCRSPVHRLPAALRLRGPRRGCSCSCSSG